MDTQIDAYMDRQDRQIDRKIYRYIERYIDRLINSYTQINFFAYLEKSCLNLRKSVRKVCLRDNRGLSLE